MLQPPFAVGVILVTEVFVLHGLKICDTALTFASVKGP
jgi:hypothetical protein